MKIFGWTAVLSLILVGWAGSASADPDKDESGHGRWRGGYERNYDGPRRGYGYGYGSVPAVSAAPTSRSSTTASARLSASGVERNGEYKEERKCRGGRRAYPAYGYRY